MWRVSFELCAQAYEHSSHLYGFSPVWLRRCTVRLEQFLNTFPQNSHVSLRSLLSFFIIGCIRPPPERTPPSRPGFRFSNSDSFRCRPGMPHQLSPPSSFMRLDASNGFSNGLNRGTWGSWGLWCWSMFFASSSLMRSADGSPFSFSASPGMAMALLLLSRSLLVNCSLSALPDSCRACLYASEYCAMLDSPNLSISSPTSDSTLLAVSGSLMATEGRVRECTIFMCCFNLDACAHENSQLVHLNGSSLVCVRRCTNRLLWKRNFLPQKSHE
uniref:Uncharacterized protein n=1 Tax=Anopheles atroparvus TaxID=41427 RepID=A0A182JD75_ANOAO